MSKRSEEIEEATTDIERERASERGRRDPPSLLRTPMPTHSLLHRCHCRFSQSLSLQRLFPCSAPDTSKCPARPWSSFAPPPSRGYRILSGGENAGHGTIGSTNIKWRTRLCFVDLLLTSSFLLEKKLY